MSSPRDPRPGGADRRSDEELEVRVAAVEAERDELAERVVYLEEAIDRLATGIPALLGAWADKLLEVAL